MKNELILKAPELKELSTSKAKQIEDTFKPMVEALKGFESAFELIKNKSKKGIDEELTKEARELRLAFSKIRIVTEKKRVDIKQEYLRAGKAIDGVLNILKYAVVYKEKQLKDIEDYFIIKERERLLELQQKRVLELSQYCDDAAERELNRLTNEEFEALLSFKKKEREDFIKAQKLAELERIEREKKEAEERERIKKENQKLREEAERLAKIEAELRKKEEEEERKRIEEERKVQLELSKNDKQKVEDLIKDLEALKTKYSFKSKSNIKMYKDVSILLDKVVSHIKK